MDVAGAGVPTSADAIVGWRLWQIRPVEGSHLLTAWSARDLEWPPRRECEARCLVEHENHRLPRPDCRCGIHAFKERPDAEVALAAQLPPGACAFGRASLWGRVVEHGRGWRAQYAYPYDLFVLRGDPRIAADLRDAYAVDVTLASVDDLVARVHRHRRELYRRRMGEREAC